MALLAVTLVQCVEQRFVVFSGDPPDISWRTSIICERISTNVVQSKKGTLYFLLGEINEKDMIEKGKSELYLISAEVYDDNTILFI